MSKRSNDQGRAYEFAYLIVLKERISKNKNVEVLENSSYRAALNAWNTLSASEKKDYKRSASAGVEVLLGLEPLILDVGDDVVKLALQADGKGQVGDVRDVLITRQQIEWEVGLSVKHNHFAVKHSRLSKTIDFGEKWYGVKCSDQYWDDVKPIFEYLDQLKQDSATWGEITQKDEKVYVPLLNAFMREVKKQSKTHKDLPKSLVEYLLGRFDFYKVIGIDKNETTQIQSYNLRGTLNKEGQRRTRSLILPISKLPTRIVSLEYKPNSKTTLELYLDQGWQFTFRIHNASSKVEPSLKFDIQLVGIPSTVTFIDCLWKS